MHGISFVPTATRWPAPLSATRSCTCPRCSRPCWSITTCATCSDRRLRHEPRSPGPALAAPAGPRGTHDEHPVAPTPPTLADFRGNAVVLFFGYTQCPDVCPTTLSTLAQAMKLLGADADRVQVLFVTIEPRPDTRQLHDGSFGRELRLRPAGAPAPLRRVRAAGRRLCARPAHPAPGLDVTGAVLRRPVVRHPAIHRRSAAATGRFRTTRCG